MGTAALPAQALPSLQKKISREEQEMLWQLLAVQHTLLAHPCVDMFACCIFSVIKKSQPAKFQSWLMIYLQVHQSKKKYREWETKPERGFAQRLKMSAISEVWVPKLDLEDADYSGKHYAFCRNSFLCNSPGERLLNYDQSHFPLLPYLHVLPECSHRLQQLSQGHYHEA